jgi:hypothetical protein
MDPTLNSLVALFTAVLFITLGISVPIIAVLTIRFLWDRQMSVGRSRELDKLVWQLHRIASALEAEKGLSLPAAQPNAEQAATRVQVQRPVAAIPASQTPSTPAASAPAPAAQGPAAPISVTGESQKAGVNSMFGF